MTSPITEPLGDGYKTLRLSVSILEEGGRLGLKCLLLSYFRVGDKNEAAGAAIAAAVAGE
jgi:hypothetical protein